jgi:hypothetical protein
MAENYINTEQRQAEICYFGSNSFSLELKDELIQILSPSLSIKLVPLSGGGATWIPPMLGRHPDLCVTGGLPRERASREYSRHVPFEI